MLIEFKKVYQHPAASGRRRWFSNKKGLQLVVWYSREGRIRGFQVCYEANREERAFTWHVDQGFSHSGIVSGGGGWFGSASPVLAGQIAGPIGFLAERIAFEMTGCEPGLLRFILKKMSEYDVALGTRT